MLLIFMFITLSIDFISFIICTTYTFYCNFSVIFSVFMFTELFFAFFALLLFLVFKNFTLNLMLSVGFKSSNFVACNSLKNFSAFLVAGL